MITDNTHAAENKRNALALMAMPNAWLTANANMCAVMRHGVIRALFPTNRAALEYAIRTFGYGPYSVMRVERGPAVLNYPDGR